MTLANVPFAIPTGIQASGGRLSRWLIALLVFSGAFVFTDPAPYDFLLLATTFVLLLLGARISVHAVTLGLIFTVFCIGGLLSMLTMSGYGAVPVYLLATALLALSALFFCSAIEGDERLLSAVFTAYTVGAIISALLGIAGYFDLFAGAEMFTRYNRAMGAFQDPNVFGPFLVLPALYLLQTILTGPRSRAPLNLLCLAILAVGIFLSFSRAAWGLMIVAGALLYFFNMATATRGEVKTRLFVIGLTGLVFVGILLLIVLQIDVVADMFAERAKLVQQYDDARLGRFARHAIGFGWAMENPLGIGALEFGRKLGEDTHNIWLKALLAYGWLGFSAFVLLTVSTLTFGARCLGRARSWQPYLFCAYAAFVGHILIAWVIDIDHWRHFYLIIGIIWGCIALEAKHQRRN